MPCTLRTRRARRGRMDTYRHITVMLMTSSFCYAGESSHTPMYGIRTNAIAIVSGPWRRKRDEACKGKETEGDAVAHGDVAMRTTARPAC